MIGMWREIKYYAGGNPTRTTISLRRRHLFEVSKYKNPLNPDQHYYKSVCGQEILQSQMSEGPTDSQKCGHCLRLIKRKQ